jgi:uncharacterized membrane protein (GlpM family)
MCAVIYAVTKISKKWGNEIGGMIASLPWVAGPILIFITLEQGISFAKNTIEGVMMGMNAWLAFCFTYMFVGKKLGAIATLLLSYLSYLLVGYLLSLPEGLISVHFWFVITMGIVILAVLRFPELNPLLTTSFKTLKYDIALRMIAITGFVLLITYFAQTLGPVWSGILTPFPIMTAVLAFFTHITQGIEGTKLILRGMLAGIVGFTIFLYMQYFLLETTSLATSITLGLMVNLVVTFIMGRILSKMFSKRIIKAQ